MLARRHIAKTNFARTKGRGKKSNIELEKNGDLSLVNTRRPVKSRTYNPLEFRAEEGETSPVVRKKTKSAGRAGNGVR